MKTLPTFWMIGSLVLGSSVYSQQLTLADIDRFDPVQVRKPLNMGNGLPRATDGYNWLNNLWNLHKHTDITYDWDGCITSEVITYATGEKYRYTYESDETSDYEYCDKWIDGAWVPFTRELWDYSNEEEILEYYRREEYINDAWVKAEEETYEIEIIASQLIRSTLSQYDPVTGQMKPVNRSTYTYFGSGLMSSCIFEQYLNGVFTNQYKDDFSWLNQTQLNYILSSFWSNNNWSLTGKTDYTWKDLRSNQWTYSFTIDAGLSWFPVIRCTNGFDSRGNETSLFVDTWQNGAWVTSSGSLFNLTYSGNNLTERITQVWTPGFLKSGSGEWVNSYKDVYSDFYNLGIETTGLPGLELTCYPVPASGRLTIGFNSQNPGIKTIDLLSTTGRLVRRETIAGSEGVVNWDISSLPQGQYLIRLTDASGRNILRKILKQ
ncbi:MAG: T9SS type A sorting domain-containing protein [Bacteroidota bacterium]